MLSKRQQLMILGGVLGGVILIGVIAMSVGKKPADAPTTSNPEIISEATAPVVPEVVEPVVTPVKPRSTSVKKPAAPTAPVLTYDQIVNSYKASGYRFQFYTCSGTPGSLSIKKGSTFMMDNRDATSHAFVVGSQKFTIGGYGYKIVTASEVGKLNITCDGKGSATINVQP